MCMESALSEFLRGLGDVTHFCFCFFVFFAGQSFAFKYGQGGQRAIIKLFAVGSSVGADR